MFELTFDPPGPGPRLAIVTIDRPGEKVNTFAPDSLDEVEGVIDRVDAEEGVVGSVIVSGKPDTFVAGADVEVFATVTDRREIEAFVRRGHAVLSRLAASNKPVVAAVHGACLGAGLELILACHHRVCTDSPKTVLGFPEVLLGLFPGAGGAARLPRLIGLREALDLILTGRTVRPRRARKLGLVDGVVPEEALMTAARDAVVRMADGKLRRRTAPEADVARVALEHNPLGRAIVFREARKGVRRKTYGLYPAPLVAIDVIEKGVALPLDRALALEPPAFAELAVGEVSRALVSLFRRSNALKKQTVAGPKGDAIEAEDVRRLGLLGGGFMGADIACVAADKGIETRIREIAGEPLGTALGHVRAYFDKRAKRLGARHVFKARSRVSGTLELDGFDTMDLIIEAVPEVLALKQDVFADLESRVGEEVVLASNTSALPIAKIGAKLRHKDRFLGLHFFSPVPKMQLLEIVKTADTSPQTIATALRFAAQIGKTPVVVSDGPGFYTTRVLGFYLMAALELIQAGHTIEQVDRGARSVGWPVGPLALLDEVGVDVGAKVAGTLAEHFPERIRVDPGMEAFLGAKRLGRKSKRGFYVYPDKGRKRPDPGAYAFFSGRPSAPPAGDPEELGERITLVAALEAVRCLDEGIIASSDDGDVGAVFGFGYPPLRGGPFRHLELRGLDTVLGRVRNLHERFGPTYAPPAALERLAEEGRGFAEQRGAT